jgi:uncharacterized OB-fold protein
MMHRIHLRYPIGKPIICLCLAVLVVGCTSTKVVPSPSSPSPTSVASQVKIGDKVKVTRKDGGVVSFKVDHVSQTGLSGDGQSVIFRHIEQISITQIDTGRIVTLPSPTSVASQVKIGDKVEITKKNGAVVKFKVDNIWQTGLSGDGKSVVFRDIVQILITQFDSGKTVTLVAGVAVVAGSFVWVMFKLGEALQSMPMY